MASGDALLSWEGYEAVPALSAALQAHLVSRNDRSLLAFDDSQTEFADFNGTMPNHYAAGGIDVEIRWSAETATTGGVAWDVAIERLADGGQDLDSDSFATAQTATDTTDGTSGALTYTVVSLTNSQIDGLLKNEAFRLRIDRDHDHASDTMTGDAEIHSVYVTES